MTLEEEAIMLLLRSPRLSVGTIIDLLEVSDREFRDMAQRNDRIAALLARRREGTLDTTPVEPTQCPACEEWFVPYAAARYCSDSCRRVDRLRRPGARHVNRRAQASLQRDETSH